MEKTLETQRAMSKSAAVVSAGAVRNATPYERKRRLALAKGERVQSRIVLTSAEAKARDARQKAEMTPGEYMAASDKMYDEDRQAGSGTAFNSLIRSELKPVPEVAAVGGASAFAQKQTAYMRGLNFGYVKDKFLVMQGSTSAARKMMALYYGVPFVIALGVGMQNYVFNTMSIYLKYQAMVDAHYFRT